MADVPFLPKKPEILEIPELVPFLPPMPVPEPPKIAISGPIENVPKIDKPIPIILDGPCTNICPDGSTGTGLGCFCSFSLPKINT